MIKSSDQKDPFPEGKFFGPFSIRYPTNSSHHLKLPWYRSTYYLSTLFHRATAVSSIITLSHSRSDSIVRLSHLFILWDNRAESAPRGFAREEGCSERFCSKRFCSRRICSRRICSRRMRRFSSKRMRRRIYLDFESKTWLVKKSEKVKKSSNIWLFMMKIIKLSKNLMKMLQNWRFQMCFRFNQSFETR
jgi:hypothetical protein